MEPRKKATTAWMAGLEAYGESKMDRSVWKNWERKVAEWFGGDAVNARRIPVTGSTNKIPVVVQVHKVNKNVAVPLVTLDLETFLKLTAGIRKEEKRIKKSLDSSKELGI